MKRIIYYTMLLAGIVLSSCTSVEEPQLLQTTGNSISSATRSAEDEGSVLSFENEDAFEAALNMIASFDSDEEKAAWVKSQFPTFKSIQDIYWDAMEEMEESDINNEKEYESFKNKYADLFFPMVMEDYGFYIPMQNLDAAFLANRNCEVKVGEEVRNLKDIDTYDLLAENGRAYYSIEAPMTVATMGSFQLNSKSMNSVGPEYDSGWRVYGNRKVKLKARRKFNEYNPLPNVSGSKSLLHLEFCFRKKTWLGWANYKCRSIIDFKANIPGLGWTKTFSFTHKSRSSHDSELEYPIKISNDASYTYFTFGEAPCEASINFKDISSILKFSWTMPGIQYIAPRKEGVPLIVPNY